MTSKAESRLLRLVQPVDVQGQTLPSTPGPQQITILAYTGGAMRVSAWPFPVVLDLAGLDVSRQQLPILLLHSHRVDHIIGQTDRVETRGQSVVVSGQILGSSDAVRQVLELYQRGFTWLASVGVVVDEAELIQEGDSVEVNAQSLSGPIYVVRRGTLSEVSVVPIAADSHTAVLLSSGEGTSMSDKLEPNDHASQSGDAEDQHRHDHPEKVAAKATLTGARSPDVEAVRIEAIRAICGPHHTALAEQAIRDGWGVSQVALEVKRQSRPSAVVNRPAPKAPRGLVLEAALCQQVVRNASLLAKWYGDDVMHEASGHEFRSYGIHSLLYDVIRAAGKHVKPGVVSAQTIRTAFEADRMLTASGEAFSTISLTGILGGAAKRALLNGYAMSERVAPRICVERETTDFRPVEHYRVTNHGTFAKVPPDGELKSLRLTEEKYVNQLDTYGCIVTLSRQAMMNDDLGGFLQSIADLGRQAANAVETTVFRLLLSNPGNFFSTANKNLQSGAATALSISSLTTAEQLFLDQVDSAGTPLMLVPAILLVPTSLKVTAQQLMTETRVNEVTQTNQPKPASNPHAGKWIPLASPHLNAQGLPNSSSTGWYLFADPNVAAAMEILYLRGQREPTIESGEADFDTLGIRWRAYYDFGVAMQDHRAAVRSTGV